jgi:hypothetical protein
MEIKVGLSDISKGAIPALMREKSKNISQNSRYSRRDLNQLLREHSPEPPSKPISFINPLLSKSHHGTAPARNM